MPDTKEKSIGIVLYYKFPQSIKYLILKHKKGHWAFAKGHRDKKESTLQTAKRELLEEAGIDDIEFLSKQILFREKYVFEKNNEKVKKTVDYFVAKSNTIKVKIDKEEIINYKWCTPKQGEKIVTFNQTKKILRKANRIVVKKCISSQQNKSE